MRDRAFLLGTLALAALALGLGLVHLTRNDLWYDEAASLYFARQHGLDFFRVLLREDTHGPLYYGLLKLWTWLFGEGEWISRLPSVLCAGCSVVTVAHLGARLFGREVGLFAALLVALSPFHIYYAQEVRFYSFIAWLASLHALCFVELVNPVLADAAALSPRSRWAWWGFAATGTACLLTFYMSGLLLVAESVCALILWRRIERKRVLGALAAATLLPAAWLPAVVWQAQHTRGSIRWISDKPPWDYLSRLAFEFTSGKYPTWVETMLAAVLVASAGATLVHILRRRERALLPLVCWLLVPLIAVLVISLRRPLYQPRYLIMTLPAFFLLAAAGLGRLRWRAIRLPLVAAILVALVIADVRYYTRNKRGERWRDAIAYLRRHAISSEVVVAVPVHESATLSFYLPNYKRLRGANWANELNRMLVRGQRLWVLSLTDHWRNISQQVTRDALLVDSQRFEDLTLSCFLLFR